MEAVARLNEIGDMFVDADTRGDVNAFRERGVALALAIGLVGTMPAEEFAERWTIVEALVARDVLSHIRTH